MPEALALAATQQLPSCGLPSCEQRQRARPGMGRFARRFARKMRSKSQDGGVASRKRARSVPEDPEEEGRSRKRARAQDKRVRHRPGRDRIRQRRLADERAGREARARQDSHRPGREVRQARQDSRKDRAGHQRQRHLTDERAGREARARHADHQRQRHLADERAGREARARQDTAFSAASWPSNMDGSRADKINNEDNPFQRFRHAFSLTLPQEHQKLREWPEQPVLLGAQPCLLCSGADFASRGELLAHIDAQHGGLQRYRNAFLHMESLCSHVVTGSEVRHYVGNYAEFLRSSAMDWDQQKPAQPRERLGCAFCARSFWRVDLHCFSLAEIKICCFIFVSLFCWACGQNLLCSSVLPFFVSVNPLSFQRLAQVRLAFGRPKVLHEEACCSMGYAVSGEVSRAVASHTAGRVGSISCPDEPFHGGEAGFAAQAQAWASHHLRSITGCCLL